MAAVAMTDPLDSGVARGLETGREEEAVLVVVLDLAVAREMVAAVEVLVAVQGWGTVALVEEASEAALAGAAVVVDLVAPQVKQRDLETQLKDLATQLKGLATPVVPQKVLEIPVVVVAHF